MKEELPANALGPLWARRPYVLFAPEFEALFAELAACAPAFLGHYRLEALTSYRPMAWRFEAPVAVAVLDDIKVLGNLHFQQPHCIHILVSAAATDARRIAEEFANGVLWGRYIPERLSPARLESILSQAVAAFEAHHILFAATGARAHEFLHQYNLQLLVNDAHIFSAPE